MGGMGGAGGGQGGPQDMAGMLQAMQNPGMQAAMRGIMSQPGMMESIANMNPQLRQMMDANPQIRCGLLLLCCGGCCCGARALRAGDAALVSVGLALDLLSLAGSGFADCLSLPHSESFLLHCRHRGPSAICLPDTWLICYL